MKIKNRKRLNFLIAAFLVVFLTGGTFAFVAAGPLLFQGTANVDASLALNIIEAKINPNPSGDTKNTLTENHVTVGNHLISSDGHTVTFGANLSSPGDEVNLVFTVENVGTMDAQIYAVDVELSHIDGMPVDEFIQKNPELGDFLKSIAGVWDKDSREWGVIVRFGAYPQELGQSWTGTSPMEPGDKQPVYARLHLQPIPEQYGLSSLNHEFTYSLEFTYGLPK